MEYVGVLVKVIWIWNLFSSQGSRFCGQSDLYWVCLCCLGLILNLELFYYVWFEIICEWRWGLKKYGYATSSLLLKTYSIVSLVTHLLKLFPSVSIQFTSFPIKASQRLENKLIYRNRYLKPLSEVTDSPITCNICTTITKYF